MRMKILHVTMKTFNDLMIVIKLYTKDNPVRHNIGFKNFQKLTNSDLLRDFLTARIMKLQHEIFEYLTL